MSNSLLGLTIGYDLAAGGGGRSVEICAGTVKDVSVSTKRDLAKSTST